MSLHDATDVVLSNPERTAMWMQLADRYIQQYNQDPEHFVLPRQHAFLLPFIETYSRNIGAFLKYLRGLRDSMPAHSQWAKDMQVVMRRVNSRVTQQIRRERASRAMRKAEELHGSAPFHVKQMWMAKLEQTWAQRRVRFLEKVSGGKRLSRDDMAEHLAEFWDDIDNEISNGERIPPWE